MKMKTAPRIFNILLTGLMFAMAIFGVFGLIFSLGFVVSDDFYNKVLQSFNPDSSSKISEFGRQALILTAFTGCVIAGSFFLIARLLKKLVATLIWVYPFVPENIKRLRKIWIILALTEAFRMLATTMMTVLDPSDTMNFDLDIRFTSWFLVFVIATLAEVFRHGAALRRDQQLTI